MNSQAKLSVMKMNHWSLSREIHAETGGEFIEGHGHDDAVEDAMIIIRSLRAVAGNV